MVLRREPSGNAVGEKSVTRELEWGIGRICGGLKNPPHQFGGARVGDFEKPLELYCTYAKFVFFLSKLIELIILINGCKILCISLPA